MPTNRSAGRLVDVIAVVRADKMLYLAAEAIEVAPWVILWFPMRVCSRSIIPLFDHQFRNDRVSFACQPAGDYMFGGIYMLGKNAWSLRALNQLAQTNLCSSNRWLNTKHNDGSCCSSSKLQAFAWKLPRIIPTPSISSCHVIDDRWKLIHSVLVCHCLLFNQIDVRSIVAAIVSLHAICCAVTRQRLHSVYAYSPVIRTLCGL